MGEFLETYVLSYQVLAAVGIVATFVAALVLCFVCRQNWTRQIPIMLVSLVGMIIGAKLFGMLSYWTYLAEQGRTVTLEILLYDSGIVFYGGLLGYLGSITLLFRFLLKKRRLGLDIVAVTTPLFHAFARVGCYFARAEVNGESVRRPCCYGVVMDNAFCANFWESRLPVQLIEAVFNLLLFAGLLWVLLKARRRGRHGGLLQIYLFSYAVFRFFIEFFRGDAVRGGFGMLSFSQAVSLLILFALLIRNILLRTRRISPLPVDPYDPDVARFDLFCREELFDLDETEPSTFTETDSMDEAADDRERPEGLRVLRETAGCDAQAKE